MFEYFPGNYAWNVGACMALNLGGNLSEVDEACGPLLDAYMADAAEASEEFFYAWTRIADRAARLAEADEASGRRRSAARKYRRAAAYYFIAERLQSPRFAPRHAAYQRALACFGKAVSCAGEPCLRVEVPYGATSLPALFVPAQSGQRAPCVVMLDSFTGAKEASYLSGTASGLAARGVGCLIVDTPGIGEALRARGLAEVPQIELAVRACLDYLLARPEVDGAVLGVVAIGLGAYYAGRAAAFDDRIRCAVGWGAVYDWGELLREQLAGSGARKTVPHLFEHLKWRLGQSSIDGCLAVASRMHLRGVLEHVRCPMLIVHGERDREVPVAMARRVYDECVNSARRELCIRSPAEGGAEHCSVDDPSVVGDFVADWVSETLRGQSHSLQSMEHS